LLLLCSFSWNPYYETQWPNKQKTEISFAFDGSRRKVIEKK